MNFRLLLKKYIIAIGLIVILIGIFLVTYNPALENTKLVNLLVNLGTTFIGTGLLILIYRFTFEDILKGKDINVSGLIEFRMERSELFRDINLLKLFRESNHVNILGITLYSIIDELGEKSIIDMAKNNKQITFLLLDPKSELLKQREINEQRNPGYLKNRIMDCVATIRNLRSKLPLDKRDNLILKFYDSDYSALVILTDKYAFFQPYLEGEDANHSAIYMYQNISGGMYERLKKHFTIIEYNSIDCSHPVIIMLTGHTAAGKTDLATRLKNVHDFEVIWTYKIRYKLFPDLIEPKDYIISSSKYQNTASKVYKILFKELQDMIVSVPKAIILDGSFPFKKFREPIYEFCNAIDAVLVIVRCLCTEKEEILRRINKRINDKTLLPVERARNEKVYNSSINDCEQLLSNGEINQNNQIILIDYDSYINSIKFSENCSQAIRKYFLSITE